MPRRPDASGVWTAKGLTLFHASRSNCSARVRLLLAEKNIDWESQLISLQKKENLTPEYFAINPKGLVPSLVCDGWIVTESNDILIFLEEIFPSPPFTPSNEIERREISRWMDLSAALHLPGVKTFMYSGATFKGAKKSDEELERYRTLQSDPELLGFHESVSGTGFSAEARSRATNDLHVALRSIDETLAKQPWLAGKSYSLADICWVTTIPTLIRGGFDFSRYPNLVEWHRRMSERPAYHSAVTAWETL